MGAFLLHLVGIFDLTTLVKEYPCLGVFGRKNGSQDGWRWWMLKEMDPKMVRDG